MIYNTTKNYPTTTRLQPVLTLCNYYAALVVQSYHNITKQSRKQSIERLISEKNFQASLTVQYVYSQSFANFH